MSNSELVKEVAGKTGLPQSVVENVLDTVVDTVTTELYSGNDVRITDLGKFSVKVREPRTGRNPRTGESVDIPEKKRIAFKAASTLKSSLNG